MVPNVLQILEKTTSLKIARKVHEAFRRIVFGLVANEDMSAESILLLSFGLISENLPLLTEKDKYVILKGFYTLLVNGGNSSIKIFHACCGVGRFAEEFLCLCSSV